MEESKSGEMDAITHFIRENKFSEALAYCEEIELEANSSLDEALKSTQMALYLLLNDLIGARHFWRRLNSDEKLPESSIWRLWQAAKNLWKGEVREFFVSVEPFRSTELSELTYLIEGRVRASQMEKVEKSFRSISVAQLTELLNLDEKETLNCCQREKWRVDFSKSVPMVHVNRADLATKLTSESKMKDIENLSRYVAYFETMKANR
mmetsp:Transcript_19334/g.28584  ORF Transcript_19334/g.28584 Transcript_19334/m.28584 type:complete len:208 (-) Transcript_19334:124-747(-)